MTAIQSLARPWHGSRCPTSLHLLATFLLFMFHTNVLASSLPYPWAKCPNQPAGRLQDGKPAALCPAPGDIGIATDGPDNVVSWAFSPRCLNQTSRNTDATRIDCLFTSTNFRNGHGISLITSTTTATHLIGIDAFADRPPPLAAARRDSQGPAFEIRPVPGKGKGIVARRVIRMGEIIMVDVPAVLIGLAFLADTKPHHRRRILKQAMNQLPDETRNRVYGLQRSSAKHEVDAIFGPNSNTVMLGDDEVHVGLFTEVAMINHACRPNAYYRFSERRLTMEVVAYHEIIPGEEIVMSYVPLETPAEERKRYLKDHWGFECTCSLCRGPTAELEESEGWRRKIKSLKETITNAKEQGYYKDAITMTEEWLMFSEWDRTPPFMPDYHDMLAHLHYLNGNMANATRYARMALDGWARFGSVDDEDLEKARVFLNHLDRLNEKRK